MMILLLVTSCEGRGRDARGNRSSTGELGSRVGFLGVASCWTSFIRPRGGQRPPAPILRKQTALSFGCLQSPQREAKAALLLQSPTLLLGLMLLLVLLLSLLLLLWWWCATTASLQAHVDGEVIVGQGGPAVPRVRPPELSRWAERVSREEHDGGSGRFTV